MPFHTWAPDAYEGASVPVTAYMATIIKAGVLMAVVGLFGGAPVARPLVDLLHPAIDLDRLGQPDGYAPNELPPDDRLFVDCARGLPLLRVSGRGGRTVPRPLLFYLIAYGLMNTLAFASLPRADRGAETPDRLDDLRGIVLGPAIRTPP